MRENNGSVSQCNVLSTSFSDHDAIVDLTALNSSLTDCRVVSSRNLRKINSAEMQADIQHLLDIELADCTDTELAEKWPTVRQPPGGQTASGRPKGNSGRLSAKWRSSGLTVYKELYFAKLSVYTTSVRKAKRQYYNDVICNCPSKQLYNATNQLLGRTKKSSQPFSIPSSELPDTFFQQLS